jgi:putative ABC transport system permease protein
MIPFLYYTNSFLIKRRKKELGLYSILGMEKKHIGIMMFFESILIYLIVLVASIILGLLFSKLIFLLLLNMAQIQVDASFSISPQAIMDSTIFYALITGINLFVNLIQVGKANPAELMSDAKGGEKEPKHLFLLSLIGILMIGYGYYLAVFAKVDSEIFLDFFLAVLLVIIGTYFVFTSGSIAILKRMKKNTKKYYQGANFITISGMLYRMKKNGASLSNICIFATMVMITVICTISIYFGMDSIISFKYPRDIVIDFIGADETSLEKLESILVEEESMYQLTPKDTLFYQYKKLFLTKEGSGFRTTKDDDNYADRTSLILMTAAEYKRLSERI